MRMENIWDGIREVPQSGISLLIQGLQIPAYIGKRQADYGLSVHAFADIVVLATAVAKYASQLWLSIGHNCGQVCVTAVAMMTKCRLRTTTYLRQGYTPRLFTS